MRKILTIALVALMAASLFAGVKTSGYVQGAAHIDIDDGEDIVLFNSDSDNKAQVNINDENKVWGTTLNAQNEKRVFKTKTWVDVMKLAKSEGDVSVKVTFLTWDRLNTLTAYKNFADEENYWRLRTGADGESANVEVGYQKMVKAQVGIQFYNGAMTADNRKDQMSLVTSVLVTPVDGVNVSAGYLMFDFDADNNASGYVAAADADVGKLADLDFSLGAGAAFRKYEGDDDGILTLEAYGEYEGINGYAEITMLDVKELKVGAGYAFNDKLDAAASVYFSDYEDIDFEKNVKIAVESNYKLLDNMSLYGTIEWAKKNFDIEGRCKVTF